MESIQTALQLLFYGVRDCLNFVSSLKYFWSLAKKEEKIHLISSQKRTGSVRRNPRALFWIMKQCLVFGAIYWFAAFIFRVFILDYCFRHINSHFLTPEEEDSLLGMNKKYEYGFYFFWTLPLFFLGRLLNNNWYQGLADVTFDTTRIQKKDSQCFSKVMSAQIASSILQVLFLIQGYVLYLFPVPSFLQDFVATFHLSLLYSLYAFEYKWIGQHMSFHERIDNIESKWPYFLGFGLILACLTSYSDSYFQSVCLFSTFFPFYVISSTVTFDGQLDNYNRPFRIFRFVTFITDCMIFGACKTVEQRQAKTEQSQAETQQCQAETQQCQAET